MTNRPDVFPPPGWDGNEAQWGGELLRRGVGFHPIGYELEREERKGRLGPDKVAERPDGPILRLVRRLIDWGDGC
jgi:hypothetical protein